MGFQDAYTTSTVNIFYFYFLILTENTILKLNKNFL